MPKGKNYKDGLFRDYFKEPKRLMALVNALLKLDIKSENEIEINTLDGVFFGSVKNDLSCIVKDKMIFITEAQSTPNANMPMRMLFYGTELIKNYLAKIDQKLYKPNLVKVATPRFFVIYLGEKNEPLFSEMKLSDAFLTKSTLELVVTVVNINSSRTKSLFKKCESLGNYHKFLDKVLKYESSGLSREDAIRKAVDYCIKNGIMSEYLKLKGVEVFNMVGFEWDEKEARAYLWREAVKEGEKKGEKRGEKRGEKKGKREGIKEGIKEGIISMIKQMLSLDTPIDYIVKVSGWSEKDILAIKNGMIAQN